MAKGKEDNKSWLGWFWRGDDNYDNDDDDDDDDGGADDHEHEDEHGDHDFHVRSRIPVFVL